MGKAVRASPVHTAPELWISSAPWLPSDLQGLGDVLAVSWTLCAVNEAEDKARAASSSVSHPQETLSLVSRRSYSYYRV